MIKRRKGSVTIFIMVFFISLITLIFAFVQGAKAAATKSTVTALSNLWADSILAEYDVNLQSRYNIFGYYGMPGDVKDKMNIYANYSFNHKKYINYNGCSCSLYNYSLGNKEAVKNQIVDVGKLVLADKILNPGKIVKGTEQNISGKIENKKILDNLPSNGSDNDFSLSAVGGRIKNMSSIKSIVEEGGNNYFENQYLMKYFKDMSNEKDLGDTFFKNEVEYVICGKKSDEDNASSIKRKIIGVREIVNTIFVMKDPKMSAEALAAAELLTPGALAPITQKGLLLAWALAESNNDYLLLINGEKVPNIKTEASWATDLQSIISNSSSGYINPNNKEGEEYEDYLNLFAYVMDEDVKILRMMDLVQINMKYLYYGDFVLRDYNCGLSVDLNINGAVYNVKKEY